MTADERASKWLNDQNKQFQNAKPDDKFKIGVRLDMRSFEDNGEEIAIRLIGNRKIKTA